MALEFTSRSDAATQLGVHERTVDRYIKSGKLTKYATHSGAVFVPSAQVDKLKKERSAAPRTATHVARHTSGPAGVAPKQVEPNSPIGVVVRLADYLRELGHPVTAKRLHGLAVNGECMVGQGVMRRELLRPTAVKAVTAAQWDGLLSAAKAAGYAIPTK